MNTEYYMYRGGVMFAFELEFLRYLESMRTELGNVVFQGITLLGEETLMILLVVTLWFAVNKQLAQRLLFITAGSLCVNGILKNLVQAPRPFTQGIRCVRPDTATGYSFPSGHTQGFATWSTAFAILSRKVWLGVLVGVLIVLVGFSRLYLGAHYPSDVVVGILLGVGIAFGGNMLFDRVRDTGRLFLGTVLAFTPFFVYFLFAPNALFADAYKTFGMLCGMTLVVYLDQGQATLAYDVPWWKKLLRIVIGVALAMVLKEGIKALNVFGILQVSLVFDAVRYFVVVFVVGYWCPLLFRRMHL